MLLFLTGRIKPVPLLPNCPNTWSQLSPLWKSPHIPLLFLRDKLLWPWPPWVTPSVYRCCLERVAWLPNALRAIPACCGLKILINVASELKVLQHWHLLSQHTSIEPTTVLPYTSNPRGFALGIRKLSLASEFGKPTQILYSFEARYTIPHHQHCGNTGLLHYVDFRSPAPNQPGSEVLDNETNCQEGFRLDIFVYTHVCMF